MMDPITILLIVLITILSVVVISFLIMIIVVLVTLKRTLTKLQLAIENVEDTALRSLTPFFTIKAMFSDVEGFVGAARSALSAVTGKRAKRKSSDE